MLIHDFKILEEKEQVHIEDNLILYIFDTLNWITLAGMQKPVYRDNFIRFKLDYT